MFDSGEPVLWSEWASVLELSCKWYMDKIRKRCIEKIIEHQHQVQRAEWTELLSLSTKLEITEIHDLAIQQIGNTLQPIEKIDLGVKCRVTSWIMEGFGVLV